MGFIQAWEKWSEKQWLNWGSKLQSKYDKYRTLKTPEWYRDLTEDIWGKLDDGAKQFLNTFVTETVKTFDEAFAKDFLDKIIKAIKKKLNI